MASGAAVPGSSATVARSSLPPSAPYPACVLMCVCVCAYMRMRVPACVFDWESMQARGWGIGDSGGERRTVTMSTALGLAQSSSMVLKATPAPAAHFFSS